MQEADTQNHVITLRERQNTGASGAQARGPKPGRGWHPRRRSKGDLGGAEIGRIKKEPARLALGQRELPEQRPRDGRWNPAGGGAGNYLLRPGPGCHSEVLRAQAGKVVRRGEAKEGWACHRHQGAVEGSLG